MNLNNRIPIMMTNQRKCPFSEIAVFVLLLCVMLLNGCGGSSYDPAALLKGERGLLPTNPEKGTVFDYYEPKGLAKWKRNWTYSLDLTGVSWNDSRTCTLIDPQHVVMAAHYIRPGDVAVMFHDRNGNQIERYITQVHTLAPMADVAVGRLNLSVPSSIKTYRFANGNDLQPGRAVFVTDQTKTVSLHSVRNHSGKSIAFSFDPTVPSIYQRNLVVGDSGNPSFVIQGGDLRLLETHTYGGSGSGPCYADPAIQSAIHAIIGGAR